MLKCWMRKMRMMRKNAEGCSPLKLNSVLRKLTVVFFFY